MKSTRNYALDMIRIAATIGIVMLHYQQNLVGGGMFFGKLWVDADSGVFDFRYLVEVFFVLSGYLQYRYVQKMRDGLKFSEFYPRKLIRLLPVLAVTTVVYEVFLCFLLKNGVRTWEEPHYPNLWSIVTEMLGVSKMWAFSSGGGMQLTWYVDGLLLCYAIMYFLVFYAKRKDISENYLFALMMMFGCAVLVYRPEQPFLTTGGGRAYSSFFAGLLLGAYLKKNKIKRWHCVMAILLLTIVLLSLIFFPDFVAYGQNHLVTYIITPSCIILAESQVARRIFAWSGIGEIGSWTYSVFLWHKPLMLILLDILDWNGLNMVFLQPVVFITFLMLVFFVGAFSYYCIEKPIGSFLEKRMLKGAE